MSDYNKESQNFQEYLNIELQIMINNSYQEVLNDIKKRDTDLIKKIQNYISRFYLEIPVNKILDKINNDKEFAMFFIKDPKKKNFYEMKQLEYMQRTIKDIKKLPNTIHLNKTGDIEDKKSINTTKSMDFISDHEKCFYVAKHINESGGAQDNQFRDMIQFAQNWNPENLPDKYKGFKLWLIFSGNYFNNHLIKNKLNTLL